MRSEALPIVKNGLPKFRDRVFGLALFVERHAQLQMCRRVVRFAVEEFTEAFDGVVELAELDSRRAQVQLGWGVVRCDSQGVAKLGNRLLVFA